MHPNGRNGFAPNPAGGLRALMANPPSAGRTSPASTATALDTRRAASRHWSRSDHRASPEATRVKGMSRSPVFQWCHMMTLRWDRTYRLTPMSFTCRSLPRTGGATLVANPALRVFGLADDKTALLAPMVSRGLPSTEARDDERQSDSHLRC